MSDTEKHRRMYRERKGEDINDGKWFPRYGNRRKEIARLKVKFRKAERKTLNHIRDEEDTYNRSNLPEKKMW